MSDVVVRLAPGAVLPDIALVAADGATSSLTAQRAGRPAVVYFMRSSTCPVCHRHVATLLDLAGAGRLGEHALVVLAPGDADDAATVRRRVPDGRAEVWATADGHAAAGLDVFLTLQHSGVVLLDARGRVLYSRTGAVPVGNLDPAELLAALPADARPET